MVPSLFYTDCSWVLWVVGPGVSEYDPFCSEILPLGPSCSWTFHIPSQPCILMSVLQKDLKLKNLQDLMRLFALLIFCVGGYFWTSFSSFSHNLGETWAWALRVERGWALQWYCPLRCFLGRKSSADTESQTTECVCGLTSRHSCRCSVMTIVCLL